MKLACQIILLGLFTAGFLGSIEHDIKSNSGDPKSQLWSVNCSIIAFVVLFLAALGAGAFSEF